MIIMTNGDMIALAVVLGICSVALIVLAEIEARVLSERGSNHADK